MTITEWISSLDSVKDIVLFEYLYLEAYDYCNVRSTKYLMGQYKYRDKLTDNLSQILNGLSEIKTFHIYDKMKQIYTYYGRRYYMAKKNITKFPEGFFQQKRPIISAGEAVKGLKPFE